MKTNFFLVGITILAATSFMSAADVLAHETSAPETLSDTLALQEVTVSATFSNSKNSPLRLTTIGNAALKSRASSRTYPELMKGIPGLYATSESGSYGDAKMNIRGFRQENTAVMLNGIPISGLVSGSMFWNNCILVSMRNVFRIRMYGRA